MGNKMVYILPGDWRRFAKIQERVGAESFSSMLRTAIGLLDGIDPEALLLLQRAGRHTERPLGELLNEALAMWADLSESKI